MARREASNLPIGGRDLRRPTRKLALPFVVVGLVGIATTLVPPDTDRLGTLLLALVFLVASALVGAVVLRQGRRSWLTPVPAYLFVVVTVLVRDVAGGVTSGISALFFLPILWLAITGTRAQLWVGSTLAMLGLVLPVLVVGGDAYPPGEWRRAVIWAAIAVVLGPVVQNIVDRLDVETRLTRRATRRSERLFLDAPHGVAVLDDRGCIVRVNGALAAMVGSDPAALARRDFRDLAPPDERAVAGHLDRILEDGLEASAGDALLRTTEGNDVHVALSSRVFRDPDDDRGDLILVNVVDVTERRRYQDRLSYLVDHDVLTGLANRRLFDTELQRHLDRCRRYGPSGALLLLDLDNFKKVNDILGHNAGDQLLVSIGGLLRRSVRSTDVVARLGGDEFAILLTDGDEAAAMTVADNVLQQVRDFAATLDGVRRRVTASVGTVTFEAAAEQGLDVFALADMTMYDAKDAGRDQTATLAVGAMRPPNLSARLQWESRIEEALEEDRFELHLQPIMDVTDGRIDSAEALLRLRGEDGELVPPARFVYIAERSGLMPQVDAWVIEHAIAMLRPLRDAVPGFCLEVNISGHSIGDPEVERVIAQALERHGVAPEALILEITETAAVADVALAREFAERLAALGCRFALDDFGAGFGSFYYLKHLIFDYVKIDGEFVANAHLSQVDRTILRSIVGIAHDLGKRTVAEFVSCPEVMDVVRAEGVDYAQGYLIGKPVPLEEFTRQFVPTLSASEE